MPLGEEPITSYFPRLSSGNSKQPGSGAKRKLRKDAEPQQPKSGPSKKRPKKAATSSLSSVSSTTPPPVWDLFSKPKSKKTRRSQVISKASSVISLDDDSDCDLTTPQRKIVHSTNDTVTRNSKGTVQAKIGSANGKQRLYIDPPSPPGTSYDGMRNNSIIDQLDTPSQPKGRRRSVSSTFSSASAPREPVHDDDGDTEILSSQALERQDERLLVLPKNTTPSVQWSSKEPSCHSNARFTNFTPLSGSRSEDSDSLANHIVESSQTQNILLNYVSPRRPRILRHSFVPRDEENAEQIVQTSQTQGEIDLWARRDNTPQSVYSFSDAETMLDFNDYRKPSGSTSHPLGRTLSDALFSVPRREASFTDTDLAFQQHEDLNGLNENEAIQEESVTESDSDGEVLGIWANKNSSHQEPSDVPSHSQYSEQTQNSCGVSGTYDDSVGSLPSVVKDFRDMFGSDGNYPAVDK